MLVAALKKTENWFEDRITRRGIFTELAMITPDVAEQMLAMNAGNRPVNKRTMNKITADFRAGLWKVNGEAIIVADDGQLNDGQHRLLACVETGISFNTLVTFGVARDSRDTIDLGVPRRVSDILAIDGIPMATSQAATTALLMSFEATSGRGFAINSWSVSAIKERIFIDQSIHRSVLWANALPRSSQSLAPPSLFAFWHNILSEHSDSGLEYINAVAYGDQLSRNDPAYVVRERLASMSRQSTKVAKTEAVLRGWNAHRDGRKLSIIKILGEFPSL